MIKSGLHTQTRVLVDPRKRKRNKLKACMSNTQIHDVLRVSLQKKKKIRAEPTSEESERRESSASVAYSVPTRGGIFKTRLNIICCMYCSQRECLCLSVWTHRRRHEKRLLVVVDVTPLGRKRSVLKPSRVVGANENCATVELSGWMDRCSGRTGPRSP